MSRAEKKELKRQKKEAKRQEKEAKKEARIQRRMGKKVGRDVWIEVDTDEVSLDGSRHERHAERFGEGLEMSSLDRPRYGRSDGQGEGQGVLGYGSPQV